MTTLNCSVKNCMYNEDRLCAKGNITVGGQTAAKPNETRCESFRERTGSMTNAVGRPSKEIDVRCYASKCDFNEACKCCAARIGIAGSGACSCAETECASFDCRGSSRR